MSYILDALNKSEKDRASNQLPGLRGQNKQQPPRMMSSGQIFGTLAALVIINSLGVYWYFGSANTDQPTLSPGQPTAISANDIKFETPVEQPSVALNPKPAPRPLSEAPLLITPESSNTRSVPSNSTGVIATGAPTVEITAHIYADDAAFRMVKIDGISRHEGDTLAGGYRVLSITESGVVLGLGEEQYELNVVEDWQLVPEDHN